RVVVCGTAAATFRVSATVVCVFPCLKPRKDTLRNIPGTASKIKSGKIPSSVPPTPPPP
uniref:Uncharacterized protein n=1 Tax=Anopheles quadriannulatus TaxID=34691 RepID=A0A182XR50_ANOQN